ncbi:unnamed protein product [Bathycoccus prasinos]
MSIQKALPVLVPDGFYQIKEMPFIGSNISTAFFTTVLYFLSALAFCGLLYLYSSDSQAINESVVSAEWNLTGYDSCNPLQGDPRYNIRKNFFTCLADTTLKVDVSNLVPSTETKSIEQREYILDGFTCKPKQIDDHYGVTVSFDECVDLLDNKTVDPSSLIEPYSGDPKFIHFPQEYLKLTASDGASNDYFGKSIAFNGNTALIGAPEDTDNGYDSGSVYVFTRTGTDDWTWTETKKLTASDGGENEFFGNSIAFDGNTALIGARGDDDNGNDSGSVYVFTRTGTDDSTWTETKKLTASDGASYDNFGDSIAFDGNTALIGAYVDDDNGSNSGSVYVFTRTGTDDSTWTETKKLTASDGEEDDKFGSSIAFDGNTALIGAPGEHESADSNEYSDESAPSGSVYVFTRTGTDDSTWTETKKLTASDSAPNDKFGVSIAFAGNTALVSAPGDDDNGNDSGSVYVFSRTGTDDSTWTETKKLTASDGGENEFFGNSIAFNGNTALIGAHWDDDNGSSFGSVYVFTRTGTDDSTWTETKKLTASDGGENEFFGNSIAFAGNTALIGAYFDDDNGSDSGSVYVFSSNTVLLSQYSGSLVFRDYNPTLYADFVCNSTLDICAAPCYEYAPFSLLNSRISIQSSAVHSVSDSCDGTGFSVKYGTKYCTTDPSKAAAYFDCRKNAIGTTSLCEFAKLNAPFACTAPCFEYAPFANDVPIEATILNSVPDNRCDATGYSVKDGSKFCTNLSATTISNYFECRANAIGVDAICEFTKSNAPYECQRKVPLPPLQRLSLAYANTLILYSALASLFAGYLYRVASKSVEEGKTREVVRFDVRRSIQNALPVLVPDGFYQIKEMPFIGSNISTAFFTTVLYFLSALAFCGLLYLYSSDSQAINESVVSAEWNLTGYDSCNPLQGDPRYNIRKNFFTCLADTLKVDVSNLVPSTETKSIEQREYILDGFTCKPKQIDDHYGVTVSFDECVDLLDNKTVDPSSLIEPYSGDPKFIHFPQEYLKLTASDGASNDYFGNSIAFAGNTALVGAGSYSYASYGSVYVFTRTGTDDSTWTETKKLTASDVREYDKFGSSIAFDGSTALIGAHWDDDNGYDSGSVYVFTRTGTDDSTWTETKKLTASDGASNDEFGSSIAFDGNTALIGAYVDDDNGSNSGSVYVFTRTGTDDSTWTETKKLTASDGGENEFFGNSITFDGNTALIGARGDDDNGSYSGSVYVFTRTGTDDSTWTETKKLTASDSAPNDKFGVSIAFAGNTALVSAPGDDDNGNDSGSVYVFSRTGTDDSTWTETKKLTASDGREYDNFGEPIAFAGNTALIGALGDDDNGYSSGSVYVFTRTGTDDSTWTETKKLTASDGASNDEFGSSIAFAGNTALIGAYFDDDNGSNSGSVYVFSSNTVLLSQYSGSLVFRDYNPTLYADFVCNSTLDICAAPCYEYAPFSLLNSRISIQSSAVHSVSDSCDGTGFSVKYGTKYCTTDPSKAAAYFDCRKNAIGTTSLCEFAKLNAPFECTAPCFEYAPFANDVPIEATILNSVPDNTCDATGYSVKDGSKFCTNLSATTISNYFECRANAIGVDAICEFTKSNAPYECQRKVPLPPLQRLSLAYANTLILYSALASLFAGYLYRVASKSVEEGKTREVVRFDVRRSIQNALPVLVPDGFYQIKEMPFIGSNISTAFFTTVLYFLSALAFCGLLYLYSSDSQAINESVVSAEWNLTGYDSCNPLQGDPRYNIRKNFFTCLADTTLKVDVSNLVPSTETKSIEQREYILDGFTCKPKQIDDHYGVTVSFDECVDLLDNKTVDPSSLIEPYSGDPKFIHFPQEYLKLTASDGASNDYFGNSIAFAGNTVLIGAYYDDDNGSNSGSVYVFTRTGTDDSTWTETKKLTASDGAVYHEFGSSIAFAGNTALVGAYSYPYASYGSVYVFTRTGTDDSTWTETKKLTASDGGENEFFGISIAFDGNTALIGAPGEGENGAPGSVYVFTRTGTDDSTWTETKKLTASDGASYDYFGNPIAFAGNTALVSAPGSVYVFTRTGTDDSTWTETKKLTASDGGENEFFGNSITFDGNTALVSDLGDDDNGSYSGSVYVFTRTGTDDSTWTETKKLTASDGASWDSFGISIAFAGNTALIGALGDDDNGYSSGSVYVFTRTGTDDSTWTETKKLTASDGASNDEFGSSIAFDGNTALIGALGDDDNGSNSGSVYVFSSNTVLLSQYSGSLVFRDYNPTLYADFVCNSTLDICAAPCYEYAPFSLLNSRISIQSSAVHSVSDSCDGTGFSVKYGTKYCTTDPSKAAAYFDCRKNAIGTTSLCEFAKLNAPFACTAPCFEYAPFANDVPIEATILNSVPDNTCDATGYSVKDGSKFCTNLSATTISNYFECRANAIGVDAICEFTKSNAPYECQRKVPLPPLQRLSLAYANTLILYSALASLFAGYLYRFPSQIEVEDSDDF